MLIFVNGDSHSAAAEAVVPYAFANQEQRYFYMGRAPHPQNIKESWHRKVGSAIKAGVNCQAESASSNTRIMRTTRQWIADRKANGQRFDDVLIIIQWSTWERQEWLIDNVYYQVNSSGIDQVPESHQQQYKEFIADVDWVECENRAHKEIWQFHQELLELGVAHLFFNGNNWFSRVDNRYDWSVNYIEPYSKSGTYADWLETNGYQTVHPASYHYGKDAHSAWAKHIVKYLRNNKMDCL